jgi:hypothetical protein
MTRVAWVSTLPTLDGTPQRASLSRSAYASELLLPHLQNEAFQIELFHNGPGGTFHGFSVYPYQRLRERHTSQPYDLTFYQVEDRPECQWSRIACTLIPGITWFHDLYFSSHGPEPILNSAWQITKARFSDSSAPWAERGGEFEQVAPLGARESTFSFIPLFSNDRDAAEFQRLVGKTIGAPYFEECESYLLPLPVRGSLFEKPLKKQTARRKVAVCSGARIEDRSHKALQALLSVSGIEVVWVIPNGEEVRAHDLLEEFAGKGSDTGERCERLTLRSDLSPSVWEDVVAQCDLALHLRFSAFGQIQPYLAQTLAFGVPALTTRFGSSESLPSDIVYQIEPGITEARQIRAVVEALKDVDAPHDRTRLRAFAHELYHERVVASELLSLFHRALTSEGYREAREAWHRFEDDASRSLFAEVDEELGEDDTALQPFKNYFAELCRELQW